MTDNRDATDSNSGLSAGYEAQSSPRQGSVNSKGTFNTRSDKNLRAYDRASPSNASSYNKNKVKKGGADFQKNVVTRTNKRGGQNQL